MPTVIDAENAIVGRLASNVAPRLLAGEEIVIINAEKAILTGSKHDIMSTFKKKRDVGRTRKGPFYPRMPDRMLRRSVRGMLPFKKARGRTAYKKLRVYIGIPDDLEFHEVERARSKLGTDKYMRLGDVARELGAKF
jgi:large subunit ribosomal protein L13